MSALIKMNMIKLSTILKIKIKVNLNFLITMTYKSYFYNSVISFKIIFLFIKINNKNVHN